MEEKKKLSELTEEEQKEAFQNFKKTHKEDFKKIILFVFCVCVILLLLFSLLYPIFAK